jgi:hypothetical protein
MISRYCYELDTYYSGTPPECINCGRCTRFMAKYFANQQKGETK